MYFEIGLHKCLEHRLSQALFNICAPDVDCAMPSTACVYGISSVEIVFVVVSFSSGRDSHKLQQHSLFARSAREVYALVIFLVLSNTNLNKAKKDGKTTELRVPQKVSVRHTKSVLRARVDTPGLSWTPPGNKSQR